MKYSILDLNKAATNSDVKVSELLRKALTIAASLQSKDVEDWIKNEINGYEDENLPKYRQVPGRIEGFNSATGWVLCEPHEAFKEALKEKYIKNSIPEIENYIKEGRRVSWMFPEALRKNLVGIYGHDTKYALVFSTSKLKNVLEGVRLEIIEWTNQLQKSGITGEEGTFLKKDIDIANSISDKPTVEYNFIKVSNDVSIHQGGNSIIDGVSIANKTKVMNKYLSKENIIMTIIGAVIAGIILKFDVWEKLLSIINRTLG